MSNLINFNNEIAANERGDSKPLTLEQENQVVNELNGMIDGSLAHSPHISLLQQFIYEYEKMKHYVAYTRGLWATEFPDEVVVPNGNKRMVGEIELPYLFKLQYEKE